MSQQRPQTVANVNVRSSLTTNVILPATHFPPPPTAQLLYFPPNAVNIQQLVRHQPPPFTTRPMGGPALKEEQISSSGSSNIGNDSKEQCKQNFAFTQAPPPAIFQSTPSHTFGMTAVPMLIPMTTPNRLPLVRFPSTVSKTSSAVVGKDNNVSDNLGSKRREEYLQSLVFKVDESKFLLDNRIQSSPWLRSVPLEPYFQLSVDGVLKPSLLNEKLSNDFNRCVLEAPVRVNSSRLLEPSPRPSELNDLYLTQGHHHHHHHNKKGCEHHENQSDEDDVSNSSGSASETESMESGEVSSTDSSDEYSDSDKKMSDKKSSSADNERADLNSKLISMEIAWRSRHPAAIHSDIWFNIKNLGNFGPTCRCSERAKRTGFRHNVFPHEELPQKCDPLTNNRNKLKHFRINIKPMVNLNDQEPTRIGWDDHVYEFEGFSLLIHDDLSFPLPPCNVSRYGILYTIELVEEPLPAVIAKC